MHEPSFGYPVLNKSSIRLQAELANKYLARIRGEKAKELRYDKYYWLEDTNVFNEFLSDNFPARLVVVKNGEADHLKVQYHEKRLNGKIVDLRSHELNTILLFTEVEHCRQTLGRIEALPVELVAFLKTSIGEESTVVSAVLTTDKEIIKQIRANVLKILQIGEDREKHLSILETKLLNDDKGYLLKAPLKFYQDIIFHLNKQSTVEANKPLENGMK